MLLFASDFHFGRRALSDEHDAARAFARLLDAHADAEALLLVGDVFEAWVEYRTLVPRLPARFVGALARWVDDGRRLVVFAGNHDPWHRSYFADELGATVVLDHLDLDYGGRRLFVHHGDGLAPRGRYRRMRPLLRHPVPVALWKMLPGDLGQRLALVASRSLRGPDEEPEVAEALRAEAQRRFATGRYDAVVCGHSHHAQIAEMPGGTYANPGAFYRTREAVVLGGDGAFRLVQAT
ncbi:MAG: UDP-2,3-diacylglucosamine diphosphatase [Rhodothermales bacterium]|nr:UDP-2,3-diacylglucosamine diphosphatase [Rhodothermales bacterium]